MYNILNIDNFCDIKNIKLLLEDLKLRCPNRYHLVNRIISHISDVL